MIKREKKLEKWLKDKKLHKKPSQKEERTQRRALQGFRRRMRSENVAVYDKLLKETKETKIRGQRANDIIVD